MFNDFYIAFIIANMVWV